MSVATTKTTKETRQGRRAYDGPSVSLLCLAVLPTLLVCMCIKIALALDHAIESCGVTHSVLLEFVSPRGRDHWLLLSRKNI